LHKSPVVAALGLSTMAMKVVQRPALKDNYAFLLHDEETGCTAAIDTPEVAPIVKALEENQWTLTHILNTHHHWDHTGGNVELCAKFPDVQIVAPKKEVAKTPPRVDVAVEHGDVVRVGSFEFQVVDVGGHTLGHVAYYSEAQGAAFVGDSIFAMGCGRMFEGDYDQFTASLKRLVALPDATVLYCAHEYTEANARFAVTVEPNNEDLRRRVDDVRAQRAADLPTVPTTVALEKATNPFVRFDAARKALNLPADASDVDVFTAVRKLKDNF